MAIDRTGISSLDAGAPDITYSGNEGPKSPQEMQQMQQMQMAQLQEEYKKYVFEMEEQGLEPMSIQKFIEQALAEAQMSSRGQGGIGNMAMKSGLIDEYRNYKMGQGDAGGQFMSPRDYYRSQEQDRAGVAYGGTANPTYTQSRKQRINAAGGGIMGSNAGSMLVAPTADGSRPGYGWEDWIPGWDTAKKIGQTIIPGGETGYVDLYGGDGAGDVIKKLGQTIMPGGDPGYYDLYNTGAQAGEPDINTPPYFPGDDDMPEDYEEGAWDIPMPDKTEDPWWKKVGQTLIPGGETGYFDLYGENQPQQLDKDGIPIRSPSWKMPMAIGAAAGLAQQRYLDKQPPLQADTSGINIADIRSRALTGSDPNLHFLPPASATTAYAQGGRTGYYAGDMVEQKENMITAFSIYKNSGGREGFRDWYSDIYLPETGYQTRRPDTAEVDPWAAEVDPWAEGAPYGYGEAGTRGTIDIEYPKMAQGGRIGAEEGGLMNLGGMEKDYRAEGGFVPLGGEERADDVPARLSKNEFVFTADAVRSAGGGDIDAGAEVMENVMNNLEQGGQISQESQGLEGARNMFATAQRLGEVM